MQLLLTPSRDDATTIGQAMIMMMTMIIIVMVHPETIAKRAVSFALGTEKQNRSSYQSKINFTFSKPGDKCSVCLKIMTADNMRTMHCGHALHESPCYEDYRKISRECLCCDQLVIRIDLPGDICSICREPMEPHTMEYLKCEHALHQTCLRLYKRNNYKSCPVCKRSL